MAHSFFLKGILLLLLIPFSIHAGAGEAYKQENSFEFNYELDAYYSNISWLKSLNHQKVEVIPKLSELNIYKTLLQGSLKPDFFLVETSINPLPILGVYTKKNLPSLYYHKNSQIFNSNIIESIPKTDIVFSDGGKSPAGMVV